METIPKRRSPNMARSKILETRGNSRKVSNAQNFEIENFIYLKKFVDKKKICQQKLPICCKK